MHIAQLNKQYAPKYPFLPSLEYSADGELCEKVLKKHLNEFFDNNASSELQEMIWKIDEGKMGEYVELKFDDNKSMFLVQFGFCCENDLDYYRTALFQSKDAFSDLLHNTSVYDYRNEHKRAEAIITAIKDRGVDITFSDLDDYGGAFSFISPFEYKEGYYFEYENKHGFHRKGDRRVETYQIPQSGELKSVCAIQAREKEDSKNPLLQKESFAKFLSLLGEMNGGAPNPCDGGSRSRRVINHIVVPEVIEQISYAPWKDFDAYYLSEQAAKYVVEDFITSWAYDGIYNYDIYQQYSSVKKDAYNDLTRYYKEEFSADDKTVQEWADNAYNNILSAHFVISSSYDFQNADNLRALLLKGESVDMIEPLLVGNWTRKELGRYYSSWHDDYEPTLFYSLKYPRLVKLLLEKGADVNAVNDFNKTALMYAAQFNLYESAKILLENGINVNAVTYNTNKEYHCRSISVYGVSALHYAVRYTDIGFIKLLLDNGADKELRDTNGKTPLDWLEIYKNKNLQNSVDEVKKLLGANSS